MIKNIEKSFENDVKNRNSHCSLFGRNFFFFEKYQTLKLIFFVCISGVYTFNITKWLNADSTIVKTWCNNTQQAQERNYLVGHLENSNLLMVVVENENRLSQCIENVESLINRKRAKAKKQENLLPIRDLAYYPNRYRAKAGVCYNYFPNESVIFKCSSAVNWLKVNNTLLPAISLVFYFYIVHV